MKSKPKPNPNPNPDLSRVRPLTREELRRKRKPPDLIRWEGKIRRRKSPRPSPWKRVCISLPPELILRARRDIGDGNLSHAVKIALINYLQRLDDVLGVSP